MKFGATWLLGYPLLAASLAGCSAPLELGNDVLWSADQEPGDLRQWLAKGDGGMLLPRPDATVSVTTEAAHSGSHAIKLVSPADGTSPEQGPILFHAGGNLNDAYYSAWFLLPVNYTLKNPLTVMNLTSHDPGSPDLLGGEKLQLHGLASGGYVLTVFRDHPGFLQEPVADPPPFVQAGRWFQIEARYEPQIDGHLRIWLDGTLVYDLDGRFGSARPDIVLSVCNIIEASTPAPLALFVDDAAISLSRVTPNGVLSQR